MTKQPCAETAADDQGEIERSVLAYLHQHPQAADTLRGIVHWWLPQQRYESGCQRIELVLSELVARGVLRRDPLPHGDALYALNRPADSSQSP
jgi:hypothetical protein